MAGPTVIPFGDPKAAKRWSGNLFLDTTKKSYWDRKFVSASDNAVIQRLTDLESDAGDTIDFDLSVQLRQKPTYGDNRLEGKEENLKFFSDQVSIDQMRHGVSAGGKMSRKRTVHNIRSIANDRLSDYWSKFIDEMNFIYLSGARGINEDYTEATTWTGHAGNAIQAPDAAHTLWGGAATSDATLDATMVMTSGIAERAAIKARMMRSTDPSTANMLPVMINGEPHYVLLMSPFQEQDMRNDSGSSWLDFQKAAAASEARNNPIFKGGMGMINNVVLQSHESVIRFNNWGAGADVDGGRALFMGRQAGVIAYGSTGGLRFDWDETTNDHGNEPTVAAGIIVGVKKTRFNNKDFGVLSIDTAAADPN
ncbi:MAG: N4-gp56 family major capsid protein [Devosia sp.]|nr:N4-gp56 family major capsid protein [Devosia sp.]